MADKMEKPVESEQLPQLRPFHTAAASVLECRLHILPVSVKHCW